MATKNIMIVGVGGQGTLLTSRILGGLAITGGYDVKLSEVHGMAQRLEREERDTDRQEYIKGRELSPHQGRDDTSQEIGIFKVSQKSQVDTQTQGDQPFAFPISFGAVHQLRQQKVANRDNGKQEKVSTATFIVEVIRKKGDKQDTGCIFMLQQYVHHHKSGKQPKKDTTTEYHRCLRIVGKHLF